MNAWYVSTYLPCAIDDTPKHPIHMWLSLPTEMALDRSNCPSDFEHLDIFSLMAIAVHCLTHFICKRGTKAPVKASFSYKVVVLLRTEHVLLRNTVSKMRHQTGVSFPPLPSFLPPALSRFRSLFSVSLRPPSRFTWPPLHAMHHVPSNHRTNRWHHLFALTVVLLDDKKGHDC